MKRHRTRHGRKNARDGFQQCGLARAIYAKQSGERAARDLEIKSGQDGVAVVTNRHALQFNNG